MGLGEHPVQDSFQYAVMYLEANCRLVNRSRGSRPAKPHQCFMTLVSWSPGSWGLSPHQMENRNILEVSVDQKHFPSCCVGPSRGLQDPRGHHNPNTMEGEDRQRVAHQRTVDRYKSNPPARRLCRNRFWLRTYPPHRRRPLSWDNHRKDNLCRFPRCISRPGQCNLTKSTCDCL